jgi:hypothetical protein
VRVEVLDVVSRVDGVEAFGFDSREFRQLVDDVRLDALVDVEGDLLPLRGRKGLDGPVLALGPAADMKKTTPCPSTAMSSRQGSFSSTAPE